MDRIEGLYEDPPIEIELVGGYFDGRRMYVPEHRDRWLFPVPPNITLLHDPEPDVTRGATEIQAYRWTGVRDDGTRTFEHAP